MRVQFSHILLTRPAASSPPSSWSPSTRPNTAADTASAPPPRWSPRCSSRGGRGGRGASDGPSSRCKSSKQFNTFVSIGLPNLPGENFQIHLPHTRSIIFSSFTWASSRHRPLTAPTVPMCSGRLRTGVRNPWSRWSAAASDTAPCPH